MRPLTLPTTPDVPCFSGRQAAVSYTWRRHQRVHVTCTYGRQQGGGGGGGKAGAPSSRLGAFAASLDMLGGADPGSRPGALRYQQEEQGGRDAAGRVGSDGRPLARKKPLKINLDLALVSWCVFEGDGLLWSCCLLSCEDTLAGSVLCLMCAPPSMVHHLASKGRGSSGLHTLRLLMFATGWATLLALGAGRSGGS